MVVEKETEAKLKRTQQATSAISPAFNKTQEVTIINFSASLSSSLPSLFLLLALTVSVIPAFRQLIPSFLLTASSSFFIKPPFNFLRAADS